MTDPIRAQAILKTQTSSSTSTSSGGKIVELPSSDEQRQDSRLNRSESTVSSSASEKASVIDNSEVLGKARIVAAELKSTKVSWVIYMFL